MMLERKKLHEGKYLLTDKDITIRVMTTQLPSQSDSVGAIVFGDGVKEQMTSITFPLPDLILLAETICLAVHDEATMRVEWHEPKQWNLWSKLTSILQYCTVFGKLRRR